MKEILDKFSDTIFTIDFCAGILILALFTFFLFFHIRRKFVYFSIIITDLIFIISRLFSLETVSLLSSVFLVVSGVIYIIINASEYRYYILNNLKSKKRKQISVTISREDKYKLILETVKYLSKSKTGAIITFEKTTNLNDLVKTGTILNAPLCQELLLTIFYPGTRLHDGAVIVRGDTILAASVYFQPTTRALTGKYGARHRAAFGISEISDAVTIVVSEETGRISLTYKGKLESCTYDSFLNEFVSMIEDKEE